MLESVVDDATDGDGGQQEQAAGEGEGEVPLREGAKGRKLGQFFTAETANVKFLVQSCHAVLFYCAGLNLPLDVIFIIRLQA